MDQILAIVWVRLRLIVNTLRHRTSGWEKIAGLITIVIAVGMSLAIAALVGSIVGSATRDDPDSLRLGLLVCFWICTVFGLMMPLFLSTGASGIDTSQLKLFPISRSRLAFLSWSSAFLSPDHVFYYPSLLAALVGSLVLRGGIGVGQLLLFLLVPVLIVTWSTALIAFVQGILRHRRGKEIASLIGVILLVSISLLPTFLTKDFDSDSPEVHKQYGELLSQLLELAQYMPPNLAANGIVAADIGNYALFFAELGGLLLWLVAGLVLAYTIFISSLDSAQTGGRTGGATSQSERASNFDLTRALPFVPPEVVAVMSKELRYLARSTVGKFNILMVPLLVAMFSVLLESDSPNTPIAGTTIDRMTLYGLLMYALLFTNNFVNNSAGWEGNGFQVYLLTPVPFERVLLGKNLGIWIYSFVLLAEVLLSWTVARGLPSLSTTLSAALLFFGSLILFTAGGNFASIGFPIARDLSSMKSQPSPPAVFISLLTLLVVAGAAGFLFTLPWMLGLDVGHIAPLLAFVLAALVIYRISLPHAADLFARKREELIAKLEAGH